MTDRFPLRVLPATRLIAVAAALLLVDGAVAWAGGGLHFALPAVSPKNKSGLRMTIDGRGVDANGYRPIRIEVTPSLPKPFVADRQLRIVLKPNQYSSMNVPEISQIIDLPEGSTRVAATIAVPQMSMWYAMGIETYEDGQKVKELSAERMGWPRTNYWDWTEARPAMLFIDPDVPLLNSRDSDVALYRQTGADPTPTYDLPDVRKLVWLFPDPNAAMPSPKAAPGAAAVINVPKATDLMLLSQLSDLARVEMLAPAELPSRWIELSQYDVTVISLADLAQLADRHPREMAALRDWLSTGPLLIVYGVGDNFERLAEVERLLAISPLPIDENQPAEFRGWTVPDANIDKNALRSPFGPLRKATAVPVPGRVRTFKRQAMIAKTAGNVAADAIAAQPADEATPAPGKTPFLLRNAGLGCVAVIAAEQPFPGQDADWIWLFNAVPESHWKWFQRNGFSLHRENSDYWTFLIPGVGQAPVWSFLLLVSLFAVVIGPLNYVLLNRARRSYLLLLTVPAGAALVTLGLFSYALVVDGLGVRLRARSFTELDQQTGRAAAWSHQSYYAAIAPSQGLEFPEDTTVFPIIYQPDWQGGPVTAVGNLVWDEGQHLRSGYLSSRTTTQFMLQRAAPTQARLVVNEGAQSGQPPSVENRLETSIRYLLLRDSRGDYYAAQTLASGARATLAKVDPAAAEQELWKLAKPVMPDKPYGYDPKRDQNTALTLLSVQRSWGGGSDASAGDPNMETSLLEANLAEAMNPTKLAPATYTAVVTGSPVVPIGVPRARQEASLHVIRGRW